MRALVAGAAGFLGSHLCDRLRRDGIEVIGLDNFCTGSRENIVQLDGDPAFSFVEHDITRPVEGTPWRASLRDQQGLRRGIAYHRPARQSVGKVGDRLKGQTRVFVQVMGKLRWLFGKSPAARKLPERGQTLPIWKRFHSSPRLLQTNGNMLPPLGQACQCDHVDPSAGRRSKPPPGA